MTKGKTEMVITCPKLEERKNIETQIDDLDNKIMRFKNRKVVFELKKEGLYVCDTQDVWKDWYFITKEEAKELAGWLAANLI